MLQELIMVHITKILILGVIQPYYFIMIVNIMNIIVIEVLINYQNISTEKERNIIIGFFNEEKNIKSFNEITNSLTYGYLDLCYYVIRNESTTDTQDKKFMEMKENEIWTNSKKKGENKFIFDEKNYKENLFEKVINIYEDINKEEDIYLLERMKNKDFIVFTYNDEKIKKEYIEKINKLYNENKNIIFLEYY